MPRPHRPKVPAWSGRGAAHKVGARLATQRAAARGSWWTAYAVGDRRDEAFMARAAAQAPAQSDAVRLKIRVGERSTVRS